MSDEQSFQRDQDSMDRQTIAEERIERLLDYQPIHNEPAVIVGIDPAWTTDCPDCFGHGCMACEIHGREFIEVYSSGDHICGQCGDEGKGEDSDLPNCETCGGTGKKRNA